MSSGSAGLVHLRGIDVIDGTPLLDIKPFVPYEALGATSEAAPPASLRFPQWLLEDGRRVAPLRTVEIAPGAEAALRAMVGSLQLYDAYQDAWVAIVEAIQLDIRRVHHRQKFGAAGGSYGFCLDVLNIVFEMTAADAARVVGVEDWSGK